MTYSVVIPCYNEGENIKNLVQLLQEYSKDHSIQWILVENGSSDNTREQLVQVCSGKEKFKIAYVDQNQGYGFGIQEGLKLATGDYVGWLHADMQIMPSELNRFINIIEQSPDIKFFCKGKRKNRSIIDRFFTACMSIFASVILGTYIYDIGAIPVLFHKDLLKHLSQIPYDFSIETYVYFKAKKAGMNVYRHDVYEHKRKKGQSSWNKGWSSKINQSKIIMKDIIQIKQGIQVK